MSEVPLYAPELLSSNLVNQTRLRYRSFGAAFIEATL